VNLWSLLYSYSLGGYTTLGALPVGTLVEDLSGILYGTTNEGGAEDGYGTVFSVVPASGTVTTLYRFGGDPDGADPQYAGPVLGAGGTLYGVTSIGGVLNGGAAFEITPPTVTGAPWTETVIHSFAYGACCDGSDPVSLIRGDKGVLYGTTYYGGASDEGVVFALTPPKPPGAEWVESIPHAFTGGSDGARPFGAVVRGPNGVLYGTTYAGGANKNGVFYQLSPPTSPGQAWQETVLYSFKSDGSDAENPASDLAVDA
jgi:uncharacterized repeat protein (TIGR03803 family)